MNVDEMKKIIICKYCGQFEYYGEMRWLSGKCYCRKCYRNSYEKSTGKHYEWNDLNGQTPTIEEYEKQEVEE